LFEAFGVVLEQRNHHILPCSIVLDPGRIRDRSHLALSGGKRAKS
jgi:hypothetical protein